MSLEEDSAAFHRLIEQKTFIADWVKTGYSLGLNGHAIPTLEQMQSFTNLPFFLKDKSMWSSYGFHLSKDEYEDYEKASLFAEELISCSLRTHYGWGLPVEETLQELTQYLGINQKTGLIEIGAGSGLWSALLQKRMNIPVLPCELNLRSDTPKPSFCAVLERDGLELIHENPDYAVMMIWPDTNEISTKVAQALKPGVELILTGPIAFTGQKEFYQILDNEYEISTKIACVNFSGSPDACMHVVKKLPEPKSHPDDYFMAQYNQHPTRKFGKKKKCGM
jgi:hypothetical protein